MPWPYCTGAQFLLFVDVRVAQQLLSDTDENIPEGSVPTNTILAEALKEASAELDQALLEHKRYDVRALMKLAEVRAVGPDPGVWLRRMTAARAVVVLRQRRALPNPEAEELTSGLVEWSERQLELVHAGKNLLPAPPTDPTAMSDTDMITSVGANSESGLVDKTTADPDVTGDLIHPRMFPDSTNPNSINPLNQGFRDGGM